jgi:hypothetical protein
MSCLHLLILSVDAENLDPLPVVKVALSVREGSFEEAIYLEGTILRKRIHQESW